MLVSGIAGAPSGRRSRTRVLDLASGAVASAQQRNDLPRAFIDEPVSKGGCGSYSLPSSSVGDLLAGDLRRRGRVVTGQPQRPTRARLRRRLSRPRAAASAASSERGARGSRTCCRPRGVAQARSCASRRRAGPVRRRTPRALRRARRDGAAFDAGHPLHPAARFLDQAVDALAEHRWHQRSLRAEHANALRDSPEGGLLRDRPSHQEDVRSDYSARRPYASGRRVSRKGNSSSQSSR